MQVQRIVWFFVLVKMLATTSGSFDFIRKHPEDSGVIEYFMKNILGIDRSTKVKNDSSVNHQDKSLHAVELYRETDQKHDSGVSGKKSQSRMQSGTFDQQQEGDWMIRVDVRRRRSQANSAQWMNLSAVDWRTGVEDEDLLLDYLGDDEFGETRPLSRHKRDESSGTEPVMVEFTADRALTSSNPDELKNQTIEAMTNYLESYPEFKGRKFTVTDVTIKNQTVTLIVWYEADPGARTALARALQNLDNIDNFTIGNSVYAISSPMLESSGTGPRPLKAVKCFLCQQYQRCVQVPSAVSSEWICRLFDTKFYPFGKEVGDSSLPPDIEDASAKIDFDSFIPYGDELTESLWISVNGLLCFDEKFTSFSPTNLPIKTEEGDIRKLLAVYWSDLDLSSSDISSKVYYQHYVRGSNSTANESAVFVQAEKDIEMLGGSFHATEMVVVTWDGVPPWPAQESGNERVNFQCAVISDGSITYALYKYGTDAMGFNPAYNRTVVVGWGETNLDTSLLNYYSFDSVEGNMRMQGHWIFKIGEKRFDGRRDCLNWFRGQDLKTIALWNQAIPACPCSEIGAILSVFWIPSADSVFCYDSFSFPWFQSYGRRCCYRGDGSSGFENRIPAAGSFQQYSIHSKRPVDHYHNDQLPKDWCCYKSDLCQLYYTARPVGTCSSAGTARGLFFGDPHITTLDNATFIFNGLGEYELMRLNFQGKDRAVDFRLQGRTCPAAAKGGGYSDATIFCALALRTTSRAGLSVELSQNRTYMIIYVNDVDYSLQFQNKANFNITESGIYVQKVDNKSLSVATPDDVGVTITFHGGLLDFTIQLPDRYKTFTRGLVGNYNDDPKDDFTFPNGTQLSNTSERNLFAYAWTWSVHGDSVFTYINKQNTSSFSNSSFQPIFLDEIDPAVRVQGEQVCGGPADIPCIFDFIATKNSQIALLTQQTNSGFQKEQKITANNPPVIDHNLTAQVSIGSHQVTAGIPTLKLTINQPMNLTLTSRDPDPDNDNIAYRIISKPSNASFKSWEDGKNLHTVFNLTTTAPTTFAVVAIDSMNMSSAVLQVGIILCTTCSGRGRCDFSQRQKVQDTSVNYFSLAKCVCNAPWTGPNCETDMDGCADRPCPHLTNCTDIPAMIEAATNQKYNCTSCPIGFKLSVDRTKCVDINECTSMTCENGECINTIGSFKCNCSYGYRQLSQTVCQDIDECTDDKNSCDQMCINLPGTFRCECETGFTKSGLLGYECIRNNVDPCANLTHNCSYGCRNNSGAPECFCRTGRKVAADGRSCEDIDECKEKLCSQNCTNTDGSYTCSCYAGYKLEEDGQTCSICPSNFYGAGCRDRCQCRGHGKDCDHIKGCICEEGWEGVHCQDDVNECLKRPGICGAMKCNNAVGSYSCECALGYQKVNGSCVDIDECEIPDKHDCQQGCVNYEGSYTCLCGPGYISHNSGRTCEDINECELGYSGCQHICVNKNGTYNCYCHLGYILTDDRKTCIQSFNPCLDFNITCGVGCTFINDIPLCYCPFGFELATDNQSCVDINECESSELNRCSVSDSCVNTNGSYSCSCPEGQLLDDGRTCKECDENHWGPGCAKVCNCDPYSGVCNSSDGCVCLDGYSGQFCSEDRDECSNVSPPCQNAHHCNNTFGSYFCSCNVGFEKDANDNCIDVDECEVSSPCDHICSNTIGSYSCSCYNSGFTRQGDHCLDVDECSIPELNKCDQGCRNTFGAFACTCHQGYLLNATTRNTCFLDPKSKACTKNCSHFCNRRGGLETCGCPAGFELDTSDNVTCKDINECLVPDRCINGNCSNSQGGFRCTCSDGSKLAVDTVTCEECEFWLYGSNCSKSCACNISYTARCLSSNGSCECHPGWKGQDCSEDVDECSDPKLSHCGSSSTCVNSPGSYRCVCNIGFFRSGRQCIGCTETTFGQDCLQKCACIMPHTQDCNDTSGECLCNRGWKGRVCEVDVDECQVNGSYCPDPHDTCHNLPGSAECRCDGGYQRFDRSQQCQDINECLYRSLNNCTEPKECNNTDGSFECICKQGYQDINGICEVRFQTFQAQITFNYPMEMLDENVLDSSTQQFRDLADQIQKALYTIGRKIISQALLLIKISSFRRGSLVADTTIEIDQRYSGNAPSDAARLLLSFLKAGDLTAGNVTMKVIEISVNNRKLDRSSNGCEVFNLLTTCSAGFVCGEVNGRPECQPSDNKDLVIGLAVGIPLFVLVTVAVAVVVYLCTRRRKAKMPRGSPSREGNLFSGSIATKKSWGTASHEARYHPLGGKSGQEEPGGMSSGDTPYIYPQDQHEDSDSADTKPDARYFWDYMVRILEPHKNLRIERPRLNLSLRMSGQSRSN